MRNNIEKKHVMVIGAGITGVTTAYYLAKRGFKVTVVDKEMGPGMLTSYANGGQLSVSNSEVWNTWSNVAHGVQWMFNPSAPLSVGFPSPKKLAWLMSFLYHTARGAYDRNTRHTIEMGLAARNLYAEIIREEGIEFDYSKQGILHFYQDAGLFEKAKSTCNLYRDMCVDRVPLTTQQVIDCEPTLAHRAHNIVGGTYTESDAMGDIHKFCRELARVCQDKYDVEFVYECEVTEIEHNRSSHLKTMVTTTKIGSCGVDHVVICAGVYSGPVASNIYFIKGADEAKDAPHIYPVKGYSLTIPRGQGTLPRVSLLDDAAKIVSSTLGDRLRVAGTAELAGWNFDIRKCRTDPLLRWARALFPDLDYENAVPWAGLRPMTPNMMPVFRRHKMYDSIWFNTGHGHLGWTLAPYTAQATCQLIMAD